MKKILPILITGIILQMVPSFPLIANDGVNYERTYVLGKGQFPQEINKYKPAQVYVLYSGGLLSNEQSKLMRGDTITNWNKFSELSVSNLNGYRILFESKENIDSIWQFNKQYTLTDKGINLENDLMDVYAFGEDGKLIDQFIFNYGQKLSEKEATRGPTVGGSLNKDLRWLLRQYNVYNSYDRNNYSVGAVWVLSIGIDFYDGNIKYRTCKSDANSYIDYFKLQYSKKLGQSIASKLFHEYLLLDKTATKDNIINALNDIKSKSSFNDYFIFNFSGESFVVGDDPSNDGTQFVPYAADVELYKKSTGLFGLRNINSKDTLDPFKKIISLKLLQEYIQLIPANNQLFITEAGPTEKFKTEFIKSLMQNSSEIASILNKNRVIIVPNGKGMDLVYCRDSSITKGPINYFITSLDSANIYDLFSDEYKANQVALQIKNKAYTCKSFSYEYFDIFFERKFLKDYNELLNANAGQSRGIGIKQKDLRKTANLDGKQYALVLGTNNYKSSDWPFLPNAINDARAIRDELTQGYGFEVKLLEDKPMDSIYKAIQEYYRLLNPNDQLLIYFAGHGDKEAEFMDDGFIVCADSKSRDQDPIRNSYIQYVKLKLMLNKIPARQVMVMLDVCHAGIFNKKRTAPAQAITNRNVLQFLTDQAEYKCRKFLSSVGAQEAFDGKPGDHSPFANLLLQVLRARGRNTNGIVTLSNIFSVLQTASMNETAKMKISPEKDGFGDDNPESDFILIPFQKEVEEKK